MPPRGRRPADTPAGATVDVKTTVEVKADTSLLGDLTSLQKRCAKELERPSIEADYSRKIALTKINSALEYGLDLIRG